MRLRDQRMASVLGNIAIQGTPKLNKTNARELVLAAKQCGGAAGTADLQTILDSYAGGTTSAASQLISDFLASSADGAQATEPGSTTPMGSRMINLGSQTSQLLDQEPQHHLGFANALDNLNAQDQRQAGDLGITSLCSLQFVYQQRAQLDKGQCKFIEQLFNKTCTCADLIGKNSCPTPQKPPKTPEVDVVGYGEYTRPARPTPPADPLFIGMNNVVAGSTIEIRNRSEGIDENQVQPWITLPVDTTGVRAEDGRLQIAIGPKALQDLKIDAWDQFEIRQRTLDGRVSKPILPDLGTTRSRFRLPDSWNEMEVVDVGTVSVPPGSIFRGFADTALVELNPKELKSTFSENSANQGSPGGMFEVSASVKKGQPFAKFVEPRARVFLKNLTTGEKSNVVSVDTDGTFKAQIPGRGGDGYEMHIYDQGRGDDDVANHRIMTFGSAGARPVVAYSPRTGLPHATDLIMERLSASKNGLSVDCGVSPGSVVTVTDLENNEQSKLVADNKGSFHLPAKVVTGKIFEVRVENPFAHIENEERRNAGRTSQPRRGTTRTVRVQVGRNYGLKAVATDQFPPSTATGKIAPAKLEDRRFDANLDLDFVPTALGYEKDSQGVRSGGLHVRFQPSQDIQAHGQINLRSLVLSQDGSKLQMIVEPHLSDALGVHKGEGESYHSSIGSRYGNRNNGDLRFRPGNFLNGYRDHIDVEVIRPDGRLLGVSQLRPDETTFGNGEHIVSWAFDNYKKVEGTVPLLDINGIPEGSHQAPHVQAKAWIEPSAGHGVGDKLSPEELKAFSRGQVKGAMTLQLTLQPPQGYTVEDIDHLEVVNLTAHPGGFAEKQCSEPAKIIPGEDTQSLCKLTKKATERLDIHNGDQLLYRAHLKDGSTTLQSQPITVGTPAKKQALTVRGDFISAGVTTRWEQIHVGDSYQGPRAVLKDGKIQHETVVMAPPPSRDPQDWKKSVTFQRREDGLVEMTWKPGTVASRAKFTFSNYTTQNPYGNGSLYSTTTDYRDGPGAGERPRLVFKDPGDNGVIAIRLGNERVIFPERMADDPRVVEMFS